ncbi:MAG TPA: aspartyl protease family protein [Gemmataceae bacterium]|nr:aspartyl protease family protein [Gemmataceae bacterium]
MTFPFSPHRGLIVVGAEVEGPLRSVALRLALDTGATRSVISKDLLVAAGYDPAHAPHRTRITAGTGVAIVPWLPVARLKALGQERLAFPVLCHNLPSTVVDGLLGLDFLRGLCLTIDFRNGAITLA